MINFRALFLVELFCFFPVAILAQNEEVAFPLSPAPDQTVHRLVTIETALNIGTRFQGIPEDTKLGPAKFASKIKLKLMQKVSKPDTEGNTTIEAFCEDAENELTVDGKSLPKNFARDVFLNKTFAITYDRQGNVKNYNLPANIDDAKEPIKQMLRQMTIGTPLAPLRVGESVISPLIAQLPLPDAPLDLSGKTKFTLLTIEKKESNRTAKLQVLFEGQLQENKNILDNASNVPMVSSWTIKGGGSLSLNLVNQTINRSDTTQVLDAVIIIGSKEVSTFMRILSSSAILIETIK